MRLGVKLHPIEEIPPLLAVLEKHEAGNAQYRDEVLNDHVHRQAEHLPVQEASQHVRDNRQGENREEVLGFETEKGDSRSEVALHGSDIKSHT
jgi:hypothetical protein